MNCFDYLEASPPHFRPMKCIAPMSTRCPSWPVDGALIRPRWTKAQTSWDWGSPGNCGSPNHIEPCLGEVVMNIFIFMTTKGNLLRMQRILTGECYVS